MLAFSVLVCDYLFALLGVRFILDLIMIDGASLVCSVVRSLLDRRGCDLAIPAMLLSTACRTNARVHLWLCCEMHYLFLFCNGQMHLFRWKGKIEEIAQLVHDERITRFASYNLTSFRFL